jgi:hypothetical protein
VTHVYRSETRLSDSLYLLGVLEQRNTKPVASSILCPITIYGHQLISFQDKYEPVNNEWGYAYRSQS